LAGFKSFVDPTELRIEAGLTGIIGPNGCGKSNLLEALRWVMGATSARSLRGSGMEDVIFAGADMRPARDQAEVTLVVDNTDKRAPARFNNYDSLEVVRRITRGKGSDYKINGEDVRAKDVQLLFADAGTGANSPALVRQGQISELINAKPENRRRVLEEAAGVAGLRVRRREAQLKLNAAEVNLDRIVDIIEDLDNRHAALQHQAGQACRYRDLSRAIRTLEALLWIQRWREAGKAADTARTALTSADEAADLALRGSASAMVEAEKAINAVHPLRDSEASAAAALRDAEHARDQLERDIETAHEAIVRGDKRMSELIAALTREAELRDEAQAMHEKLNRRLQSAQDRSSGDTAAQERAQAVLEDADTDCAEAEQALDAASAAVAQIKARRDSAERDVFQAQRQVETLEAETLKARETLKQFDAEAAPNMVALAADVQVAIEAVKTGNHRVNVCEADAETARNQVRETRESIRLAQADVRALEREIAGLERLLNTRDEGDRALDHVRAAPGYEKALAAALGDDLEAGLAETASRFWKSRVVTLPALPPEATPLIEYVQAPEALTTRLRAVGIVNDDQLNTLADQLQPGQRLVSRAGALHRWDGFVSQAGAPSVAAVRLEGRNRLSELAPLLEHAHASVTQSEGQARQALQAESRAEAALIAANQGLKSAEKNQRGAEQTLSEARTWIARAEARRTGLLDALESVQSRLETARERHAGAQEAVESARADDDGQAARNKHHHRAEQARSKVAEARAALESIKREIRDRRHHIASLEHEITDWEQRKDRSTAQVQSLNAQIRDTEKEMEKTRGHPALLESRRGSILDALENAESTARTTREAVIAAESAHREADTTLRIAEKAAADVREARASATARLNAAEERLAETVEQLENATGEQPQVLQQSVADSEFSGLSSGELERRLNDSRRSRERLGAVNLRADEEACELDARRILLSRERDDLLAAISRLRNAVDTLSREGRARLLEAFDVVNKHFHTLFETLFEGGAAELRLIENNDPLEAGLEIFACPPGKKMETMSLMSGGEQALTATALIFAVFLVNPAPVCVLDEVDSPLDDANVDRYCTMLEQMQTMTGTRFMVITHAPVTMSRMNRLFGVTMGEKGVSQLVSVNLSSAETILVANNQNDL